MTTQENEIIENLEDYNKIGENNKTCRVLMNCTIFLNPIFSLLIINICSALIGPVMAILLRNNLYYHSRQITETIGIIIGLICLLIFLARLIGLPIYAIIQYNNGTINKYCLKKVLLRWGIPLVIYLLLFGGCIIFLSSLGNY